MFYKSSFRVVLYVDIREDSEVCASAVKPSAARKKRDTTRAQNVTAIPQDVLLIIINLNYTQPAVTAVRISCLK